MSLGEAKFMYGVFAIMNIVLVDGLSAEAYYDDYYTRKPIYYRSNHRTGNVRRENDIVWSAL